MNAAQHTHIQQTIRHPDSKLLGGLLLVITRLARAALQNIFFFKLFLKNSFVYCCRSTNDKAADWAHIKVRGIRIVEHLPHQVKVLG